MQGSWLLKDTTDGHNAIIWSSSEKKRGKKKKKWGNSL